MFFVGPKIFFYKPIFFNAMFWMEIQAKRDAHSLSTSLFFFQFLIESRLIRCADMTKVGLD